MRDFDLATGSVLITKAYMELRDGTMLLGPPKSAAGVRSTVLPDFVWLAVLEHIDEFVDSADPTALVFCGPSGRPARRSVFNKTVRPSVKDLMARLSQSSIRAAMIYMHRSQGADRRYKSSMDDQIEAFLGSDGARGSHGPITQADVESSSGPSRPMDSTVLLGAGDENRTRTFSLGSWRVDSTEAIDSGVERGPDDPPEAP